MIKFGIKNLGPIEDASIELEDLTIVCGKNNTGKTYFTDTFYSFLNPAHFPLSAFLSEVFIDRITDDDIKLLKDGMPINFDLAHLCPLSDKIKTSISRAFIQRLPKALATTSETVKHSSLSFNFSDDDEILTASTKQKTNVVCRLFGNHELSLIKAKNQKVGTFVLKNQIQTPSVDENGTESIPAEKIKDAIRVLVDYFFEQVVLPSVFITTCERTGAAIFRNEFIVNQADFDKDVFDKRNSKLDVLGFKGYPLPIRKDIDLMVRLSSLRSRESYIAKDHAPILSKLAEITGGQYEVNENNRIRFRVARTEKYLDLAESSSSVKSLASLYFYLLYKARPGQILIFDEPELSLHPESQRRIAHLIVRLVNAGLRVLITTHSDYIVREINLLLRIRKLSDVARTEIEKEEAIESLSTTKEIRCYILAGGATKEMTPSEHGSFPFESFDTTMADFDRLFDRIVSSQYQDS